MLLRKSIFGNKIQINIFFLIFFVIVLITSPARTSAQEGSYLAFSAAYFDVWQQSDPSFAACLEYRSGNKIWILKPFTGFMVNSDFAGYIFSGFHVDIPLTSDVFLITSLAPGIYSKARSKDLFLALEFRSQIEIALQIASGNRVGVSFNHMSNASLGRDNPGVENLSITYSIILK